MELIWTAFLLGFLGSFHCAGMCGPLALALPGNIKNRVRFFAGRLAYNLGRMVTYFLIGLLMGAFGLALNLAGFQQTVSVLSGIIILIMLVLPESKVMGIGNSIGLNRFVYKIKTAISKALKVKGGTGLFLIGLVNGLLPCGFVYIAVAAAINANSLIASGAYMALFGLGTFPMMMLISLSGQIISINFRNRINKAIPYVAATIGILFILRGMSLGIPYISPDLSPGPAENMSCH